MIMYRCMYYINVNVHKYLCIICVNIVTSFSHPFIPLCSLYFIHYNGPSKISGRHPLKNLKVYGLLLL